MFLIANRCQKCDRIGGYVEVARLVIHVVNNIICKRDIVFSMIFWAPPVLHVL